MKHIPTLHQTYAAMDLARILGQVSRHLSPEDRRKGAQGIQALDPEADVSDLLEGLDDPETVVEP